MTTIYDELIAIFGNDIRLRAIINTVKRDLPENLRLFLFHEGLKRMPEIKSLDQDKFWVNFGGFKIWEIACFGKDMHKEGAANLLRECREAALKAEKPYPPPLI